MDCACAVGLGFGPLVFTLWATIGAPCFFKVFLTCFGVPKKHYRRGSASEAAPLIFDFKNNTLVYLYLLPSMGASTCSLVGSSLEPAAGSTSPSASTRPRSILTHMGYSWESSGHFGETLGLHFGTLGSIWVPLGSMLVSCGHCGVWPSTPRATFVEKAPKRHTKWRPK